MTQPLIYCTQPVFKKILEYRHIPHRGELQWSVPGFEQYNFLTAINSYFSNNPSGDIVDRTQTISQPWNMWVQRPWRSVGSQSMDLDRCFYERVQDLLGTGQPLNLFWSGGIDSTSMLVGFLKHTQDLSQLRVLYSTNSIKENPYFFLLLQHQNNIDLIDFSGDVYLDQNFDGLFISADGADDITASLDASFYQSLSWEGIHKRWQDFFNQQGADHALIEFYEHYCKFSGVEIKTVLQARWWFYTICKIQKFPGQLAAVLKDSQPLPLGFFDCQVFEHWSAHNFDKILPRPEYSSYKQYLKDYIYLYDHNQDYQKYKEKVNSDQLVLYRNKKQILQNSHYIMLLQDGTRVRTSNLPFISELEYQHSFGNKWDYLFNVSV